MKKYIALIVILIIIIGGIAWYLSSSSQKVEESPDDYLQKAKEYMEAKQYSLALEQYKLAINIDPTDVDTYLAAADIYIMKGHDEEAVELMKNGESSVDDVDVLHYRIGKIYYDNNDIEGALQYFESAQKENPQNWENAVALAKVYSYYSEKYEEAVNVLQRVDVQDDEGMAWVHYYLALYSYQDVNTLLDEAQKANSNASGELRQDLDDFLEVAKKIQADQEDIVQNNTLLGYEMIQAEMYPMAITLLEGVVAENDEYYAAYMYMGISYMNMEDLANAVDKLTQATNVEPNELQPWIFLAQVYTLQNDQKDAIDTFEQALTLDKENEEVRYDYAQVLESFGLHRQARLQYEELIAQNTESIITYKVALVYILLDHLEEYEEGLAMAKSLVDEWEGFKTADEELQAELLDLLGWAYKFNNQKDEALKYLEDSKKSYTYLASTYYHLGVIYSEIESYVEARSNLERAVDLDLGGDISILAKAEIDSLEHGNDEEDESENTATE